MTPAAAQALKVQAATLRLLSRETAIPLPEVIAFDASCNNDIGAPYLCMSFVPGCPVSKAWFDAPGLLLEERRRRTLSSLGRNVAQLFKFRFRGLGSPRVSADGALAVGPCYHWDESDDVSVAVVASGPFD